MPDNGVAEVFVKTFKRNYVGMNNSRCGHRIAAVAGWIADYNKVHPHTRLAYQSPREYIERPIATRRVPG